MVVNVSFDIENEKFDHRMMITHTIFCFSFFRFSNCWPRKKNT